MDTLHPSFQLGKSHVEGGGFGGEVGKRKYRKTWEKGAVEGDGKGQQESKCFSHRLL